MKAKKSFGQHFLTDPSVARRMVAAADFSDIQTVVEVGPGTGALTQELVPEVPAGASVVLVEADRDLVPSVQESFPSAQVIQGDAVGVDFDELTETPWLLLSNLPYNAGNAIIMNALRAQVPPRQMVVMVQKEVADRMLAKPGEMSVLSVSVQVYAQVKRLFNVKPGAFSPPPKVDSSVIELRPQLHEGVGDLEKLISLAKAGFSSRRKQLHRNFADAGIAASALVKSELEKLGKLPTVRAQELSISDWVALSNVL